MPLLRWALLAWAAIGCMVELPLALAEPACPVPATGPAAAATPPCAPPPPPPTPLDVLLSGGGILGSLIFLRKA